MTAPRELHDALDRVFDGIAVEQHGDHFHATHVQRDTVQATIQALMAIPDEHVTASKAAALDLASIIKGIEQGLERDAARRN